MTELTEAGGPCSTKMSMRQFKRYGIVDVHASLRLIEKSCNQKERTPHRDVQYTVGRLITTEDQCLKQQDALPCYRMFIEKVTKTVVFGLDKVQERLGTNNQF
jgi:hypothetical protein